MNIWPDLKLPTLSATLEPLHLWAQIVGKVKLASLPWVNESWHIPLYVSATGLTTGLVTTDGMSFDLTFDFEDSVLRLSTTNGRRGEVPLASQSVAEFHEALQRMLADAGIVVTISPRPSEIADPVPFVDDSSRRQYDPAAAREWWLALVQVQRVFHRFRSRFVGKSSPIHFFWGGFDLAVTRFSGKPAPLQTHGAPNMSLAVNQDAYAGELASFGFWPGGNGADGPHFYVEAWPTPPGFAAASVVPETAYFGVESNEWLLSYADVVAADDPDAALMDFLQSGYVAIAEGGGWAREALDRAEGPVGRPPPLGRTR